MTHTNPTAARLIDSQLAARLIDSQLAAREQQFAVWFSPEDAVPGTPEADRVLATAAEHGWSAPERDEDVTDEDYAQEVLDSAVEHVIDARDGKNAMDEDVLGVSTEVTVTLRVELSTGGPADYLTAELDPRSGEVSNVLYHYAYWFDHAATPITSGSPLYSLVENYASAYAGMELSEPDR